MKRDDDVPSHLGRYEVIGRIALGTTAEVLLAQFFWHGTNDARLVVIKRLRAELAGDAQVASCFLEASNRAMALMHSNIAAIFEVERTTERTGDGVMLVMEPLYGRELRALARRLASRRMRMPLGLAVHLVREVCLGVDHAHQHTDAAGAPLGVVHGDVSPHHVHICFNGEVKLRNFEGAGLREGRTGYMPPETGRDGARGARDQRSDVFGLGLLLHELITGQLYRGEEPPRRGGDDASYPAALERIVRAALARERAHRTETAGQLAAQLDEVRRQLRLSGNSGELARLMQRLYASELATSHAGVGDRAQRLQTFRAKD